MEETAKSEAAIHRLGRPGGEIAYELQGNGGPLVVLVPSMGDTRDEYRLLAPMLADAGFRVASMDLRGLGDSSATFEDYSASAVGGDIDALVAKLSPGRPAFVVGTSMGAAAAVWAAAERPEAIGGFVVIGPFVRDVPVSPAVPAMLRLALFPLWGRGVWVSFYRSRYRGPTPPDFDAHVAAVRANLKEKGRFRALRRMVFASKADCEERMKDVKSPVLVVMGRDDPDFKDPEAEAKLVAERLRGDVHMVDGAGHYPQAELPNGARERIVSFLKSRGGVPDA